MLERGLGRVCLGLTPAAALAAADDIAVDGDLHHEMAGVIGALAADDAVGGRVAGDREGVLLQTALGCLQHIGRQRRVQLGCSGVEDESAGSLEALVEVDGGHDRFEETGQHGWPLTLAGVLCALPQDEGLADAEAAGDTRQATGGDDGRAAGGEDAFLLIGMALEERFRHDQRKHSIPEELQALIGARGPLGVFVHIAAVDERFGQKRGVVEFKAETVGELRCARRHRPRWGLLVEALVDVVDSVLDGADVLRVFVRDLGTELLLEAHDELDEVKGVGVQVIHERRLKLDIGLVHTELLDDDLLESLEGRSGHSLVPSVWAWVTVSVTLWVPPADSSSPSIPSATAAAC